MPTTVEPPRCFCFTLVCSHFPRGTHAQHCQTIVQYLRSGGDHIVDQLIAERTTQISRHPLWPVLRPILVRFLHYRQAVEMADMILDKEGIAYEKGVFPWAAVTFVRFDRRGHEASWCVHVGAWSVASRIPSDRIANARALEGMTAVILNVNKRYKAHAGIRLTDNSP